MSHTEDSAKKRRELVSIARRILSGEIGSILGCRSIVALLHEIGADSLDDDFVALVAVDSKTDALPVGSAREFWDTKALLAQDREIERKSYTGNGYVKPAIV